MTVNYRDTLNLPDTEFSMKAGLPRKEPEILEMWSKKDLYGKIRKKYEDKELFLLHDGPPYANGDIHLGHSVNKILKDITIKYKTLKGFNGMNKPVITHLNTQDVNNERNTEMLLNALQITPNDLTYLRSKPAYSFIHDSITGVLGLKALCDAKGITTVFASCFSGGVMEAINNMGIHIKHFPFYEVEQQGFSVRHDFPSHYNQQEHDLIYKKFKESYPEFFKLYKQKD